ncbi:transglutaminase family protein [Lacisediminihabitans sp. FW035]
MAGPDLATRPAPPAIGAPSARPVAGRARSAELRTSGALLLALLVTIAGLHVILEGASWWFQLALLCALLLGTAAVGRRIAPVPPGAVGAVAYRRLLPPVVSVIVLVLAVTVVFVPSTAILGVIPTTQSWDAFQQIVQAANFSIARQSLPAVAVPSIMFLLCLGVGALTILADFLANTLRTPALAGVPLLVLLAVPSIVSIDITDPIVFVLAAIGYLLLLRANAPRRQTALAVGLSSVVVVGALVAPLLLPEVNPAQNTNGTGFSSGVNPVLSLGENLRQDVEHTVLEYSSESGTAQYLRLVSLQNFSGSNWAPDAFRQRPGNTTDAIGAPPGLSADVATKEDEVFVSVDALTSPWLPLPYPTSSVGGLDGDWYWDSDGLAVKSPNRDARNQTYRAMSLIIDPTPAQLASAGTTVPAGFERFLALPPAMPKIIAETADRVAGGAASNYEKALLLQEFFRDGDFQYSETAPVDQGYDGTGMTVIAAFLKAKEGYCIHFASAMAVMARSLGIPSRIAVGFLPGTQLPEQVNGRTAFTVTSHNLHAWPELYFEGIGWTRFEPTVGRGEVPAYADAASPDVPTPINTATPTPSDSATAKPSSSAAPLAPEQTTQATTGASRAASIGTGIWLVIALVVAAILGIVPAAIRLLVRRRRLRGLARGGSALTGWREILDTATDLAIDVPDTATARDTADRLAVSIGGADRAPIDRVRAAVERESYASNSGADRAAGVLTMSASLAPDVRRVLSDLRAAAGRGRRARAALVPASVIAWMSRGQRSRD